MLDTKGLLTVNQYADYRNISRQRVYKMIRQGKLSESVYKIDGKTMIDPDMADKELSENLDQIYNRPGSWPKKTAPAARLEIQNKAVDVACTGEESGYIHPWPVWAARYISALVDLDSRNVDVERIDKTHWRLTVHDLDTEAGEPIPWAVDMAFNFNLGG